MKKIKKSNSSHLKKYEWKNKLEIYDFLSIIKELETQQLIQPTDFISLMNICNLLDEIYSKQKEIKIFNEETSYKLLNNEISVLKQEMELLEQKMHKVGEETEGFKKLKIEHSKIQNEIFRLRASQKMNYFSINKKNELVERKDVSISQISKDLQFLLTATSLSPSTKTKLKNLNALTQSSGNLAEKMNDLIKLEMVNNEFEVARTMKEN